MQRPIGVAPPGMTDPTSALQPTSEPPAHFKVSRAAVLLAKFAQRLLTLTGCAAFARTFSDYRWVLPVFITAFVAQYLSTGTRRRKIPPVPAMAVCLVAVFLLGIWLVSVPTAHGLPDATTFRALSSDLAQTRATLGTITTPTATTPGWLLIASWAGGLVTVLGDWGAFRLHSTLQGIAPSAALFGICCAFGVRGGNEIGVVAWVAAALLFLFVHRRPSFAPGAQTIGYCRLPSRSMAIGGSAIGIFAIVAASTIPPLIPTQHGGGLLGWNRGPVGGTGTRSVESPVVDLHTRLVDESDTPVFTVTSTVPSYWRLTSLDTFTGQLWQSTDSYQAVGRRLPGLSRPTPNARTVSEDFHIQTLDSVWLPSAFDPEAVTGTTGVTFDPVSGSLLTSRPTSDGLTYHVTSVEQLATLDAAKLIAAPVPRRAGALLRDLQLPPTIPPAVVNLARTITAGDNSEYAKALAIQDYLRGPAFTYSTDPPADGYGISALSTFLLQTRTGYCQQFAGSYAVLARLVGIPTRLAVGFATGSEGPAGTYHVTDADAHTWPEVYFPTYGWVPFEPTKSAQFAIPGAGGYSDSSAAPGPTAPSTSRTGQANKPPTSTALHPHGAARVGAAPTGSDATLRNHSSNLAGLAVGGAALALVIAVLAGVIFRRRSLAVPDSRFTTGDPRTAVVGSWQNVCDRLSWRGLEPAVGETPHEIAVRISRLASALLGETGSLALGDLGTAVTQAAFSAVEPSQEEADRARLNASTVNEALTQDASLRQRLRWVARRRSPIEKAPD